ncbi:peptidase M24 [Crucibulum laeve]|uniref:Peptidase M24 n=1 Tax=Crucibulum laeve TaxID=68775 RepID=A0A5C3MCC3_9AGAR|nr:peptidase M24 [Crucibulum laeve]
MLSSLRRAVSVRRVAHPHARRLSTYPAVAKPSVYGQPVPDSHPHLFQHNDELTPGIPASDYEQRRKKLMDSLPDNSIVVAVSAPIKYMSANIFYKYRQNSDFWYLTGFEEPDSAVILEKSPSTSQGYTMTLFSTGKDSSKEKWDGARTNPSLFPTIFRATHSLPITSFSSHFRSILPKYSNVYIDLPNPTHPSSTKRTSQKSLLKFLTLPARAEYESVLDTLSTSKRKPLAPELARLRAIKSPAEQCVMRQAADISARAHAKTMRFTRPGLPESALAAHFEYLCALEGAQRPAYVPVVASGANALIIHYTSNNHIIRPDEMLLIDAGCEFNGYASDITRTYPSTGTFSPAQRDLYSAILSAQKSLIKLCVPSSHHSLLSLHRESCSLLRQELNQIGFNLGREGDLERVLYPHFLSHPIGIDLHESAGIDRGADIKPGMVITIEPGIYVPPTPNFPTHFHNIGIRIEDEVLITESEPIILSVSAPKEIVDVEGACQGLLGLEPY